MNCVVTGASGFIGSQLVKRLSENGHHVRAVLHVSQPRQYDDNIDYVTADLTDPTCVSDLVQEGDVVFHCAALVKDFGSRKQIMNINFWGTKNLVEACGSKAKRFIFLSHLHNLSTKKFAAYSHSKALAEQYLLRKYHDEQFPAVIVRPGNVYGPGATTWCLRPLRAIQQNHIALIDQGSGLFLHTYIDNLLDAFQLILTAQYLEGEVIEITDGDNNTTWRMYLNDLAALAGKPPITRNMTKTTASIISQFMMIRYFLFHLDPLLTPTAVSIFTNKRKVTIEKATKLLGYTPVIGYAEGMRRTALWLKTEQYI